MTTILIVDDESQNIDVIKDRIVLSDDISHWDILAASSYIEAHKLLSDIYNGDGTVDLLLTDMIMESENSGIELIKFANELDPRIMSILFTASEASVDRHSVFDIGAFEIIEKNRIGSSPVGEIINKAKKAILMKEKIAQANDMAGFIDKRIANKLIKDRDMPAEIYKLIIVFWDIRGFSRLCEILKSHPRLISNFLTEYNTSAVEIISKHGGIIDKFIGDGVMGIFGWDDSDDMEIIAYKSIKASIELRDSFNNVVEKHLKYWKREVPDEIKIYLGYGIHIGDVLFGEVGSSQRRNVTAIGNAVNFAARIEGRSDTGDIIISGTVHSYCEASIFATKLPNIDDIKNIHGVFEVYRVDGLK